MLSGVESPSQRFILNRRLTDVHGKVIRDILT